MGILEVSSRDRLVEGCRMEGDVKALFEGVACEEGMAVVCWVWSVWVVVLEIKSVQTGRLSLVWDGGSN